MTLQQDVDEEPQNESHQIFAALRRVRFAFGKLAHVFDNASSDSANVLADEYNFAPATRVEQFGDILNG